MNHLKWLLTILCCLFSFSLLRAAPTPEGGLLCDTFMHNGAVIEIRTYGDEFYGRTVTSEGYTVMRDTESGIYYYLQQAPDGLHVEKSRYAVTDTLPPTWKKNISPSIEVIREIRQARYATLRRGSLVFEREYIQRLIHQRADTARINALIERYNAQESDTERHFSRIERFPNTAVAAPPEAFTADDVVGLVILVNFQGENPTVDPSAMAALFNQENYSANGNSGSIYDYYFAQSFGKVKFTNIVVGYYQLPETRAYYNANEKRGEQMINDAVACVDNDVNAPELLKTLTEQGERGIALSVLYAGASPTSTEDPLWPKSYSNFFGRGKVLEGHQLRAVQISNIGTSPVIGTFAHELGHMLFGFDDYYDYGKDGTESAGLGNHCLMAAGNHLNSGKTPGSIHAYLKYRVGWMQGIELSSNTYTLRPDSSVCYIASNPNDPTEYFVIEARSKTFGDIWQRYLPAEGLAIWHIDEDAVDGSGSRANEFQDRTATRHYESSLEQADGLFDLEKKNDNNRGDKNDYFGKNVKTFSAATTPNTNWWNGTASNIEISGISDPGESMTFTVMIPGTLTLNAARTRGTYTSDPFSSAGEMLVFDCSDMPSYIHSLRLQSDLGETEFRSGINPISVRGACRFIVEIDDNVSYLKRTWQLAGHLNAFNGSTRIVLDIVQEGGNGKPSFAAPSITPESGIYEGEVYVELGQEEGGTIYYSLNESLYTLYTDSIRLTQSATLSAYTAKNATTNQSQTAQASYEIQLRPVRFSPEPKRYSDSQYVYMQSPSEGAVIYYTLAHEGEPRVEPTESSTRYMGEPIFVPEGVTAITARAFRADALPSKSATATYEVRFLSAPDVVFSAPGGVYTQDTVLHLTAAHEQAVIYYTLDGSAPNTSSLRYDSKSPLMITSDVLVQARAYVPGYLPGAVASAQYERFDYESIALAFTPEPRAYTTQQKAQIAVSDARCEIRYTLNGSAPQNTSTLYSAPITIDRDRYIRAAAFYKGVQTSGVFDAVYTFSVPYYTLTLLHAEVVNDTDTRFSAGTVLQLRAKSPDANKYTFDHWETSVEGVLKSTTQATTTYTQPAQDVAIEAVFRENRPLFLTDGATCKGGISLRWLPQEKIEFLRYELYRSASNEKRTRVAKLQGNETTYCDESESLLFGKRYTYELVGIAFEGNISSNLFETELTLPSEGVSTFAGACGTVHTLSTEAIALDDAGVSTFVSPAVSAVYCDIVTQKTKKIALKVEKPTQGKSAIRFYSATEIALYDAKAYKKRTTDAKRYLDAAQQPFMPLQIRVKKPDAAHKKNYRTFCILNHYAPCITQCDSFIIADTTRLHYTLSSIAQDTYELPLKGRYFGMKNPKVYAEYTAANGKIKTAALKVMPSNEITPSALTRSAITDEDGNSSCRAVLPVKKWKKRLPGTVTTLILSNGKSSCAVEMEIEP